MRLIGIVDDDADILEVYSVMLESLGRRYGYEIRTFTRSLDFIKFLELTEERFEDVLLLADINMPGMDGLSLLEFIHQSRPEIKVIMQSGISEPSFLKRAFQAGASDYFIKPIDFRSLINRIEEKIEKNCFH